MRSPFSGLKLVESTEPARRDQRLLTPQPAPSPAEAPSVRLDAKPIQPTPAPSEPKAKSAVTLGSLTHPLDLADEALFRNTYAFTEKELEALEDLHREYRRELDVKVTRNDLIRCGLHLLVEDYHRGEQSHARRKLRQRRSS